MFSFTFRRVRFIRKAADALNENFGIATGGLFWEVLLRGGFGRWGYFRIIDFGILCVRHDNCRYKLYKEFFFVVVMKEVQMTQQQLRKLFGKLSKLFVDNWSYSNFFNEEEDSGELIVCHGDVRYLLTKDYAQSSYRVEGRRWPASWDEDGVRYDHYDYRFEAEDLERSGAFHLLAQNNDVAFRHSWVYGRDKVPDRFGEVAGFYEKMKKEVLKKDREIENRRRQNLMGKIFGGE